MAACRSTAEIPLTDDGQTHSVRVVLGEELPRNEAQRSELGREEAQVG